MKLEARVKKLEHLVKCQSWVIDKLLGDNDKFIKHKIFLATEYHKIYPSEGGSNEKNQTAR